LILQRRPGGRASQSARRPGVFLQADRGTKIRARTAETLRARPQSRIIQFEFRKRSRRVFRRQWILPRRRALLS